MGVSGKYKIILVDDHKMFRDALKSMLVQEHIAEIIGEADNGQEFLNLLDTLKPDLVLMDIDMPQMDGITATQKAVEKIPDLKILILSMFGDENHYKQLIIAGAKGFIMKSSGKRELENGIKAVAEGENYFSADLLRKIIVNIDKPKQTKSQPETNNIDLTEREMETLKHLCSGLTNQEIADKMFLSVKSVEFYRSKLLQKTELRNTVNLVLYALKNGIVTI